MSRLRQTGTHRGATFGLAPIGVPVEYAGAAVSTCRDHRIQDVWVSGDVHGLIWQLRAATREPCRSHDLRKIRRASRARPAHSHAAAVSGWHSTRRWVRLPSGIRWQVSVLP